MAKPLIIVESPTKAKTISQFLGSKFTVTSSFGHIRDLPKSKMGVDIEGGTFLPTYKIPKEKTEQVKKLKELAKKSGGIIFATDEDREGEAISWHLAEVLGIPTDKAERIVFHEITKTAIEHALAHPRAIDQQLVDAQQARRIVDRLVGYELSPLLWKKVARGLSAGRVQSVAVKLIVEREKEREAFISQAYWTIDAQFSVDTQKTSDILIPATLQAIDTVKIEKFDIDTEEKATNIVQDLEKTSYSVSTIEQKDAKRTPPPPFRTSTMQQQANQKHGFSSKQTMRLAQQLYEGIHVGNNEQVGLITYMRTDSTNLSDKFLEDAQAFITKTYGNTYALEKARRYTNTSKGAQEAHEAIRPTDPNKTPESLAAYLDPQQLKLYTLIWKRTIATQMAEAVLAKTSIDIEATGISKKMYRFHATGQQIRFDGWLLLYPEFAKEQALPVLTEGMPVFATAMQHNKHETQPPARYSDATLIKIMETYGIGRPSTYAPTIATIEAREYVTRDDDKRFAPTLMATIVTELLSEHFPDIVDYHFTAQMEENLDAIALGQKHWQPIIATFYQPFHNTIVEKTDALSKQEIAHARELGIDPATGKPISVRIGRYGPFVQLGTKDDEEKPRFAAIPKEVPMDSVTLDTALVFLSLPRTLGEWEGQAVIANTGRFGPYVQVAKEYFSLKKSEKSPYTITFNEAQEVITQGREEKAKKIIKEFPDTTIKLLRGPYGAYITDGTKNARIPKDCEKPEELTQEQCEDLLKNAKPKRKFPRKKKATA